MIPLFISASKPTVQSRLARVLLARGYSECSDDPVFAQRRVFAISPNHRRRIDKTGARVHISPNGAVRIGRIWEIAKPLPKATKAALLLEAEDLLRPVSCLAQLGL